MRRTGALALLSALAQGSLAAAADSLPRGVGPECKSLVLLPPKPLRQLVSTTQHQLLVTVGLACWYPAVLASRPPNGKLPVEKPLVTVMQLPSSTRASRPLHASAIPPLSSSRSRSTTTHAIAPMGLTSPARLLARSSTLCPPSNLCLARQPAPPTRPPPSRAFGAPMSAISGAIYRSCMSTTASATTSYAAMAATSLRALAGSDARTAARPLGKSTAASRRSAGKARRGRLSGGEP